MTYRSSAGMSGLGALTPENIAAYFQMYVGSGGCNGSAQVKANMQALQCLSLEQIQIFGQCYTCVAPKGVNNLAFYAACKDMAECGVLAKVGCPPAPSLGLPECATSQDMLNEMSVAYCEKYPTFNGPDAGKNTICWGVTRYPQLYMKLKSFALCPPPVVAPPPVVTYAPPKLTAPPPRTVTTPPQETYTAPPPVNTMATATPDSTPTGIQSGGQPPPVMDTSSAWPTTSNVEKYSIEVVNGLDAVRVDLVSSDGTLQGTSYIYPGDPAYADAYVAATGKEPPVLATHAGMNMALWGIGGVLALGAAYLLLRKKK